MTQRVMEVVLKTKQKTCRFKSKNGLWIRVRPLAAEDAELLIELFDHLSPQSRYLRFNEALENPDPEYVQREAARLATVQPELGIAWIALADLPGEPNAPVAGARFIRTRDPEVAEVSVAVRDDLQGHGIGSKLMLFLAREAKAAGIHRFVASFHTSNRAVWNLLSEAPFHTVTEIHGSETDVVIELNGSATHVLDKTVVPSLS